MKDRKLPRAYAQALLETASEDWMAMLKGVEEKIREKGILETLDDPDTAFSKKEKTVSQLLPKGTTVEVRNFLLLLAKENRFSGLGEIIAELEQMARYGPQAETAYITSAVPLTPPEEETIRAKLSRRFPGQTLAFRFEVDPQLLGGVVVRVGDKVINGSLAGKLQALREKLRGA